MIKMEHYLNNLYLIEMTYDYNWCFKIADNKAHQGQLYFIRKQLESSAAEHIFREDCVDIHVNFDKMIK